MRRRAWWSVVVAAGLIGAACEGRYRCDRADDGSQDCAALCGRYCRKVRECGIDAGPGCQDGCERRTEAGGQTSNFSCVIENDCADSANCSM